MFLFGILIGALVTYLLLNSRKNQSTKPPVIDFVQLRDQAAGEVEQWATIYPDEARQQTVHEVADKLRKGVLPPQVVSAASAPVPHVEAAQMPSQVPYVEPIQPRDTSGDIVNFLAILGAFIVVAGITVFSIQADGVPRFLLLASMTIIFYTGGMLFRDAKSLRVVAYTFLGIGLVSAPFAMLSISGFTDLTQQAVLFLTSLVCTFLYGFTSATISSELLKYLFLGSIFVTTQTAMSNLNANFSWYMLTLCVTGLMIALVQRFVGLAANTPDKTTLRVTQAAVLAGSVFSLFGLMDDINTWPVVCATLFVSALYFFYSGRYEMSSPSDKQWAWAFSQVFVITAIVVAAGSSSRNVLFSALALLLIGLVYSFLFVLVDAVYQQRQASVLRNFHILTISVATPLAFLLCLTSPDAEMLRTLSVAVALAQFLALQYMHNVRNAVWGWGFALWLLPVVAFSQLAHQDALYYAFAYAAELAIFLLLWLWSSGASFTLNASNTYFGLSAFSMVIAAALHGSSSLSVALLWLALALAIAAWKVPVQGFAAGSMSALLFASLAGADAATKDQVVIYAVLFVAAAAAYLLSHGFALADNPRWQKIGLELRITNLAAVLVSSLLNATQSEFIGIIAFYTFAIGLLYECWQRSQIIRESASTALLIAIWWTLAYNGVDNMLAYTYAAAIFAAILAAWHRSVTGPTDQSYQSLVIASALLAGVPIAFAALGDKETYALPAIAQNLLIAGIGLLDEFKPLRWIGFWTIVGLICLQLLAYGFLFLWFIGAVLIGMAVFFALKNSNKQ